MEDCYLYHSKFSTYFKEFLSSINREVYQEIILSYREALRNPGNVDFIEERNKEILSLVTDVFLDILRDDNGGKLSEEVILRIKKEIDDANTISLDRFSLLNNLVLQTLRSNFFPQFKESTNYEAMLTAIRRTNVIKLESIISASSIHKDRFRFLEQFIQEEIPTLTGSLMFLEKLIVGYKSKLFTFFELNKKVFTVTEVQERYDVSFQVETTKQLEKSESNVSVSSSLSSNKRKVLSSRKTHNLLVDIVNYAAKLLNEFLSSNSSNNALLLDEGVRSYLIGTTSKIQEHLFSIEPKSSFYRSSKSKKKQRGEFDRIFQELEKLFLLPESTLFKWVSGELFPSFLQSQYYIDLILQEDLEIEDLKAFSEKVTSLEMSGFATEAIRNNSDFINYCNSIDENLQITSRTNLEDESDPPGAKTPNGELNRFCCGVSVSTETLLESNNYSSIVDVLYPFGLEIHKLDLDQDADNSELDATQLSFLSDLVTENEDSSYLIQTPDTTYLSEIELTIKNAVFENTIRDIEFQEPELGSKRLLHAGKNVLIKCRENFNSKIFQCNQFVNEENVMEYSVKLRKTKPFGFGLKFMLDNPNTNFMVITGFSVDKNNPMINQTTLSPELSKVEANDILIRIRGVPDSTSSSEDILQSLDLEGIDFHDITSLVKQFKVDDVVEFSFVRSWEKFYKPCLKCEQIMCQRVSLAYPNLEGQVIKDSTQLNNLYEEFSLHNFFLSMNSSDIQRVVEGLLSNENIIFLSDDISRISLVFYFFENILSDFKLRECYNKFASVLPNFSFEELTQYFCKHSINTVPNSQTHNSIACGLCTRDFCLGTKRESDHSINKFIFNFEAVTGISFHELISNNAKYKSMLVVDCDTGIMIDTTDWVGHLFDQPISLTTSNYREMIPRGYKNSILVLLSFQRRSLLQTKVKFDTFIHECKIGVAKFLENIFFRDLRVFLTCMEERAIFFKDEYTQKILEKYPDFNFKSYCVALFNSPIFETFICDMLR